MMMSHDLADLESKIVSEGGSFSDEFVTNSFNDELAYVLSQVEYIKSISNHLTWNVSTWCNHASFSTIEERGTEADKERLGVGTFRNKSHSANSREKRKNNLVCLCLDTMHPKEKIVQ